MLAVGLPCTHLTWSLFTALVPSVSSFLSSATCFLYPGCFPESVFVLCVTDNSVFQPESPRSGGEVFWFPTTFLVAGRSSDRSVFGDLLKSTNCIFSFV